METIELLDSELLSMNMSKDNLEKLLNSSERISGSAAQELENNYPDLSSKYLGEENQRRRCGDSYYLNKS